MIRQGENRQAKQHLIKNDLEATNIYPEAISLETFGGLKLADFQRPKPLLLLVYLALEGAKPRRHLAELFWPDAADPMKSLTVALTRLRQGAPNVVDADNVKAWAMVKTDAQEMVEMLEGGKLEQALAMYKGPFLEGFYLPDWSAELEEWVYKTREFLAGQVREALLGLAERAAREGQFATSAKHAEAAYQLSGAATPEPEDLPRFYAFMLAGGSSQAARVRQEAQGYGLKLTLVADEARRQWQQTLHRPVYSKLPSRATAFVGRDLELTEIATLLSEQDCQLLTLVGPPGVGKTRLALQLAREQAKLGLFKDGVYYVALESLSAETLFPSILATLELDAKGLEEPLEKIVRHIGEKNVLLVFDNFEHLIESAPFVATLAGACPNLKLLITSRERLNLESEQIFSVSALPFPKENVSVEEAQNFDAISLFAQRAKRARPDFTLDDDNLPHILRLCRFVEGLPLALELAAAWIRVMTCEEMAEELEHNVDLLSSTARDMPERHKSVRVAFENYSWRLLTAKEQEVFRNLSVFKGGFRREAASVVAGATIPVLASLVDKSLLRVATNGRYDFHPLLYQFTREKLTEQLEEKIELEAKHGTYFLRLSKREGEALKGNGQKEALSAIGEELENIRTAWFWMVSRGKFEELQPAVEPLTVFFDTCRRCQEGINFMAQTATHLRDTEPRHRVLSGMLLVARAWLLYRLAEYEEASQLAQRGLELLRPFEDYLSIMKGLNALGGAALRMGDHKQAKLHWEKALSLAKEREDEREIGTHVGNLAIIDMMTGNYQSAKQCLHQVLTLHQKRADYFGMIAALNTLGIAHLHLNELQEAQQRYEEGLQLARDINLLELIPIFLGNLAEVALEKKEYAKAYSLGQQALQKSQENTDYDRSMAAAYLITLGKAVTAQGDTLQAHTYFRQALEVAWTIKATPQALSTLVRLAEVQAGQGHVEQAVGVLSFTLHHPAIDQDEKDYTQLQLDKLRDQLSTEEMDEAIEHGKTMKLEEVVAAFIEDSSHPSVRYEL